MNNLDDFIQTLNESLKQFDLIITCLKNVEKGLLEKQRERNGGKTVGTVLSTIGTGCTVASVALAPFTGGLTLFVAGGMGAVTSIAGGGINILTDYEYGKFQEEQVELLKGYVGKLEDVGKKCDGKLGIYGACLKILNKENYDEDTAKQIIRASLGENLLFLEDTEHLFLLGSRTGGESKVRLTNSEEALRDLGNSDGVVVKDVLRDKIVIDFDPVKKDIYADCMGENFFRIPWAATTGVTSFLHMTDILEKATNVAATVGKVGITSSAEILKTVQISAKEIASFGTAGLSAGKSTLETGVKLGKSLGYATAGLSIVLTAFEIGSLINQFGEQNVLVEETTKVRSFVSQKQATLEQQRDEVKEEDDEDKCKCKKVKLKVLYFNGRSINSDRNYSQSKMNKIRELLFLQMPNIVAICETWLTHDQEDNQIECLLALAGYSIFRQDRNAPLDHSMHRNIWTDPDRRGGGLLVAFRAPIGSNFTFSRYNHLDYQDCLMNFLGSYNYACGKCPRKTNNQFKFGFVVGYRPPGLSKELDDALVDIMNTNCGKIMLGHNGFAMVADFNCGKKNVGTLGFSGYYRTNFSSTHVSGNGLDQVVYYDTDFVCDAKVIDRVSDHNAIIFNLNFGKDCSSAGPCQAKSCD